MWVSKVTTMTSIKRPCGREERGRSSLKDSRTAITTAAGGSQGTSSPSLTASSKKSSSRSWTKINRPNNLKLRNKTC